MSKFSPESKVNGRTDIARGIPGKTEVDRHASRYQPSQRGGHCQTAQPQQGWSAIPKGALRRRRSWILAEDELAERTRQRSQRGAR